MESKQTPEIRIPGFNRDWEERKLGELIEISSAARVHKNEWTTSGVRFFRSSDVVSNFNGKKNTPAFISYSLYDELSKKSGLVQPGDILITGGGSIGIPYLVADQEPLYFKDADLIWLKSANKIVGYFLYSYFVTPQLRKYISNITHIGTISHYTIEQAKDTPILLPEQVEQTQIGNFFKQLDDTIALHQQELTTLKETKQGFLQKMFPKEGESVPKIRFPGFTEDWEQCELSKGMTEYTERVLIKDDKVYKQVSVKNIGEIILRGEQEGSKIGRKRQAKVNLTKHPNTLIFTRQTIEQGGIGFAPKETDGAIVTENMPTISVDTNVFDRNYIITLVKTGLWRKKVILSNIEGGTAQIAIHEDNILKSEILFPKINEQQKIGIFFKQLDDTITLHQRELDALKETKKAFLQKMFV